MMITATRNLLCCLIIIIIITCSTQYHSASSFILLSSSSSSSLSPVTQRRQAPHVIRHHHDTRSLVKIYVSSSCDTTAAPRPSSSDSLSSSSRSQYWINDEILKADEIIELLGVVEDSSTCTTTTTTGEEEEQQQQPTATTIHRNKAGKAIAVEVTSAITMSNVKSIRALSKGIQEGISSTSSTFLDKKKKLSQHFTHRGFGEGQGGNDCTYLAPFLQVFCPTIATSVKNIAALAWKAASWDVLADNDEEHPDPMSLGIRTSEYLSYQGWPSLEAHKDICLLYTSPSPRDSR